MICLFLLTPVVAKADNTSVCQATFDTTVMVTGTANNTSAALTIIAAKEDHIKAAMKEIGVISDPKITYAISSTPGMGEPDSVQYNLSTDYKLSSSEQWPKISQFFLKEKANYEVSYSYDEKADCTKSKPFKDKPKN